MDIFLITETGSFHMFIDFVRFSLQKEKAVHILCNFIYCAIYNL